MVDECPALVDDFPGDKNFLIRQAANINNAMEAA
jgi:hypothetical protein